MTEVDCYVIGAFEVLTFEGVEFVEGWKVCVGDDLKQIRLLFVDNVKDCKKMVSISLLKKGKDDYELLLITEKGMLEDDNDRFKSEQDLFNYLNKLDLENASYDDNNGGFFCIKNEKWFSSRQEHSIWQVQSAVHLIKNGDTECFNVLKDL